MYTYHSNQITAVIVQKDSDCNTREEISITNLVSIYFHATSKHSQRAKEISQRKSNENLKCNVLVLPHRNLYTI